MLEKLVQELERTDTKFGYAQKDYFTNWKESLCRNCENCRFGYQNIDSEAFFVIKCSGFNLFLSESEGMTENGYGKIEGKLKRAPIQYCYLCGEKKEG